MSTFVGGCEDGAIPALRKTDGFEVHEPQILPGVTLTFKVEGKSVLVGSRPGMVRVDAYSAHSRRLSEVMHVGGGVRSTVLR